MRLFRPLLAALPLLFALTARAQVSEPSAHEDDVFDVMSVLAWHGLHDLKDERWNAYGQFTYISSFKLPFSAAYSDLHNAPQTNSLSTSFEHSFTGTVTVYVGAKLWPGAEAYFVPEVILEKSLSDLHGLGGTLQNFELQKNGTVAPTLYESRFYLKQTVGLGGAKLEVASSPMSLGSRVDRRRLVLTAGNFSLLDIFDRNSTTGDARRRFFNMAFLTNAAYDFAADGRGYVWGATAEVYFDDWALRLGRATPPRDPNGLPLDFRLFKYYGDQVEVEHAHRVLGRAGSVRILGYRNRENMGKFEDAIAALQEDPRQNATRCSGFNYGSQNPLAPDLCFARRPNVKAGIGVNVEQSLSADVGLFFRGMVSDGQTEVYSFTPADSSISMGAVAQGALWRRTQDTAGVGYAQAWISGPHADYLRRGGIDGFIGDGALAQASEHVLEVFYSLNVVGPTWLSLDYQHIWHPAFNADRGPVDIFGVRAHAEF